MPVQRLFIGVLYDSQATLAAPPPDRADHGRAVILVGAVPALFIGSPTWGGRLAWGFFSFFPPRSETSRQFPSAGLSTAAPPACRTRSFAAAGATYERSGERGPVLRLEGVLHQIVRPAFGTGDFDAVLPVAVDEIVDDENVDILRPDQ
jgi:hypothetical protein